MLGWRIEKKIFLDGGSLEESGLRGQNAKRLKGQTKKSLLHSNLRMREQLNRKSKRLRTILSYLKKKFSLENDKKNAKNYTNYGC